MAVDQCAVHESSWMPRRHARLSFVQRCEVSGQPYLAPRTEADESRTSFPPRFDEAPSKRLRRAAGFGGGGQDPSSAGWKFAGHLEEELRQLRIWVESIRSFSLSWKPYCSGWHAWHHFMLAYHPTERDFPLTLSRVAAFGSHFRNAPSLSTYLAWIRSGQTLLGIDDGFGKRFSDALMRGMKASERPVMDLAIDFVIPF